MTSPKILEPGLKLIGAKTKIRDRLYPRFPEHRRYIEPFMGTAGVLIGKERCVDEVATDLNEHAINYYHVLQKQPDLFFEEMLEAHKRYKRYGKSEFITSRHLAIHANSSLTRAVHFYLVTKHCMNGIWRLNREGDCNSSYCGTADGRGVFDRAWFDRVVERVSKVQFIHCDYRFALQSSYYRPRETFVFLDPPYHACKTTYNGIAWKDEHYYSFVDVLADLDCNWMLTINADPFIRAMFAEYEIYSHEVGYSCSQTTAGRGKKPELIITNYNQDACARRWSA